MGKVLRHYQTVLLLFFFAQTSSAQQAGISDLPEFPRDTILHRFVHSGAHLFPIFNRAWQNNLDSALQYLPHDAYLWQQKAMPYFKARKYQIGIQYLDSAVKYDAQRYLDYRAFMKCIFMKDYWAAISDFLAAKRLIGEGGVMDHPYDFYLGLCYLQLNQFDSAAGYLQLIIEKQEQKHGPYWVHHLHYFYLGVCYMELSRFDEAISLFDKALKNYPGFADAQFYKSLCLAYKMDLSSALELAGESRLSLASGRTFIEDNSKYEFFPYQVDSLQIDAHLHFLKAMLKAKQTVR